MLTMLTIMTIILKQLKLSRLLNKILQKQILLRISHQIANPNPDLQGVDPVQDPGVIPDQDLEVIIHTQVHPAILDLEVDLDPDLGLDPDQEQGRDRDLDHNQTYPEDGDLHHF